MRAERVLVVDGDEASRRLVCEILDGSGHHCVLAGDIAEARAQLRSSDFALAICDVELGGESGLDLVREARSNHPDLAVLMAGGQDDPASANAATADGAYGYLIKPFGAGQLLNAVQNALHRRRLELETRVYRVELERAVDERTSQLQSAVSELRESREETVKALARAVEARNGETGAHIARIGATCGFIAQHLGLDSEQVELVRTAAAMHDVGKIGIPDRILMKPGPLTKQERREIELHPIIGNELLSGIGSELLGIAAVIALTHHEWYDGSGYPRSLNRETIPLAGRIVAVADVFDALTSDRVYRPAFSVDQAVQMMRDERGTHFDPELLDILLDNLSEILALGRAETSANRAPELAPASVWR